MLLMPLFCRNKDALKNALYKNNHNKVFKVINNYFLNRDVLK